MNEELFDLIIRAFYMEAFVNCQLIREYSNKSYLFCLGIVGSGPGRFGD